ncbi:hypothetical protein CWE22_07690 [Pseudidiomarina aestuarii]|uniref:Uncharacterized protein n=1 Tax=Pseudidiomarina aestuarii TaxID=624146 RepID=A0A7Z6ZVU8_9GAMM|nr:hypothetical protein [Pseudidiomarina aestuarii]RUO42015.1 hypothetical protein CWE22_07690 [Pseudidiomarina aestuarii]
MNKIILLLLAISFVIGLIVFRPFQQASTDAKPIQVADELEISSSQLAELDERSSQPQLEDEHISDPVDRGNNQSNKNEDSPRLSSLIDDLSAEGGLSDASAQTAFKLEDFDALVYQLESDLPFEQTLIGAVNEVAGTTNGMVPRSVGCNDEICAVVVDYLDPDSIEQFAQTLMADIQHPVSLVTQPVTVQGITELRLLLSYKSAKIVAD